MELDEAKRILTLVANDPDHYARRVRGSGRGCKGRPGGIDPPGAGKPVSAHKFEMISMRGVVRMDRSPHMLKEDVMPNHVTNQITFGTDKAALAVFRNMLEAVQANGEPLGSIDFNKLIPMPPGLHIEQSTYMEKGLELYRAYMQELDSSDPVKHYQIKQKWEPQRMADPVTWALGKQAFENIQKYGSPTWYGWAIKNWGSKWNAYRCEPLGKNAGTMTFLTAWSAVPNILEAMSRRYPDQTITYRWADEDIGYNVGEKMFRGGKCVGERALVGGSREACELAAEIKGVKLSDLGLYLTPDKAAYEYREPVRPAAHNGNRNRGESR